MAAQTNESPRRILSRIEKSGNMDVLRNQIIEHKVIKMIMDAADFVEVPYEMEELATEEALDRAASVADDSGIPEVTEEEAKESAREAAQGNK